VVVGIGVAAFIVVNLVTKNKTQDSSSNETRSDQTSNSDNNMQPANNAPANEQVMNSGECKRNFDQSKMSEQVDPAGKTVTMEVKDFGTIKLSFSDKDAPKSTENFLRLVNAGFYNCLTFHRVAKGFVIQGGDPSGDGTGGPGYTVPAEIKLP